MGEVRLDLGGVGNALGAGGCEDPEPLEVVKPERGGDGKAASAGPRSLYKLESVRTLEDD